MKCCDNCLIVLYNTNCFIRTVITFTGTRRNNKRGGNLMTIVLIELFFLAHLSKRLSKGFLIKILNHFSRSLDFG